MALLIFCMNCLRMAKSGSVLKLKTVNNSAKTLSSADNNTIIKCINDFSTFILVSEDLEIGFSCIIIQGKNGVVNISTKSTDTLNGSFASISTRQRLDSVYLNQYSEGCWEAITV